MRIAIIQASSDMVADSAKWMKLARQIREARPDVLVTNEMPFGSWLAESNIFSKAQAEEAVQDGVDGVEALKTLDVSIILSSRPVASGKKLANEAFALVSGDYKAVHHKQFFPDEPGYYEANWFEPASSGFDVVDLGGWSAGFLLCTELFFTEWARHYRREGANLIAVPRASGESLRTWLPAAQTAAIVSGCYVASSNRAGSGFGGRGFVISPLGELIAETSESKAIVTFDLDLTLVAKQQKEYPCYVREFQPA